MYLIDKDKEKEKLLQWAIQSKDNFSRNEEGETYYHIFTNKDNVVEYDFQTLPELSAKIAESSSFAENDDVVTICAIAAYKRKPNNFDNSTENKEEITEEKLPDYVYVF